MGGKNLPIFLMMPYKPTDDDEKLWKHVTKGTKTYQKDKEIELKKSQKPKDKTEVEKPKKEPQPQLTETSKQTQKQPDTTPPQLNRRDSERLRKGQMEIEAKLDLHGMRQHEAQDVLIGFIQQSIIMKRRCVLVVTGKGSISSPSVIREKLPEWLKNNSIASHVLQYTSAQPKHGGSGAFYVYLKKSQK